MSTDSQPSVAFADELSEEGFGGLGRFAIRRRLGAGAYGVVYEAYDRERRLDVAVKRLHHLAPTAIYRFKQEFRALADLSHPNLVQLHELLSDGRRWYFSMELVPGVPLHAWVRPAHHPDAPTDPGTRSEVPTSVLGEHEKRALELHAPLPAPTVEPRPEGVDVPRVRDAFRQLAEGVCALHGAGKLHRDLKSQNVLVAPDGRVVLLDFGLVHELGAPVATGREAIERDVVGTPIYMAPEQGAGAQLAEATDWYAVGVMLHRALSGRYPFAGRALEVIVAKQTRDAPALAGVPGVAPDLAALADALLARAPQDRPSGREVVERLSPATRRPPEVTSRGDHPFIARGRELAELFHAYAETRRGRGATVLVHGPSGVGKSSLVARFLSELGTLPEPPLVLAGRCYARESLPFKAIDAVVDSVARHLAGLPPARSEALLPPHVAELASLFPVLRRIRAIEREASTSLTPPDPIERRRRAFVALRALFTSLAREQPVVVFVDDLHWGDVDGAQAVAALMQPPNPPPLLLLGSYRSDEAGTSPFLRTLDALEDPSSPRTLRVALAPLDEADARRLALALVGDRADAAERAAVIARESAGNPLFLEQLATAQGDGRAAPSLAEVVLARISALPPDARRVLEVLAVAGQPLEADVAREASNVASLDAPSVRALHTARLVRSRRTEDGRELVEVYHDRIRETAVAHLATAPEAALHARLADALLATGRADAETLATHRLAAGDVARAFAHYREAAARAAGALAFDRAARLYRAALDVLPPAEAAHPLQVALGDALRDAGRGAEAAGAYERAAETATGDDALELRRRAAEQLLYSGHVDEGRVLLDGVLRAVGLRFPTSVPAALASFFGRRAQVRLRGLEFERRDGGVTDAKKRLALDACWSAAIGLAMTEPVYGGIFQSLHLLLALESGDVERVARALAVEVPFSATSGMRNRDRTAMLTRRAKELAAEVKDPRLDGLLTSSIGGAAWLEGRWNDAIELEERADRILRTSCTGVAWEIDSSDVVLFDCLWRTGRWREVAARYPDVLADARVRGDLYAEIYYLVKFAAMTRLAQDDPADASDELSRAVARWTKSRFQLLHFWELHGQAEVDLYAGRGVAAHARTLAAGAAVRGSLLLQLEYYRVSWTCLRGRVAVAAAGASAARDRERLLREAHAHAKTLCGEGPMWAACVGALVAAGAHATAGARDAALAALDDAERLAERTSMGMLAAAARARRAELSGDHDALERAHGEVAREGIRAPDRIVDMLVPGRF